MAAVRKLIPNICPAGGALPSTTDGTTWVTVCEYTVTDDDCAIGIDWHLLGIDSAFDMAESYGNHRAVRVSSVLSIVGSILSVLTFNTGALPGPGLRNCSARINISGDIIQLQVKGVAAHTIGWQGWLTIRIN